MEVLADDFNLICQRLSQESLSIRNAGIGSLAQSVEQRTFNPLVACSSHARPTNFFIQTPSSQVLGVLFWALENLKALGRHLAAFAASLLAKTLPALPMQLHTLRRHLAQTKHRQSQFGARHCSRMGPA